MTTTKTLEKLINILDEKKADNIICLNVKNISTITDKMIICSATSKQHAKTLANAVIVEAKKHTDENVHIEGYDHGEWILIDLFDAIIHVMQSATREFYSLEKLWAEVEEIREQE